MRRKWTLAYLVLGVALTVTSAVFDFLFRLPTGLTRSVTAGPGFEGESLQPAVVDPEISLAFIDEDAALPRRFFSVRWDGVLYLDHDRGLELHAGADDRLVVTIDGQVAIERSADAGMHTIVRSVSLRPGFHRLQVEYEQHGGGYRLNLAVAPTGGRPAPFDPNSLFPAQPNPDDVPAHLRLGRLHAVVMAYWTVPAVLLLVWYAAPLVWRFTGAGFRWGRSRAGEYVVATSVVGLLILSAALRVAYVSLVTEFPGFFWVDPDNYTHNARLLTETGSWRWTIEAARYQGEYFKAPLYSVFLSLFSHLPDYLFSAAVAGACLEALTTVGIFFIGRSLHSDHAGLLAAGGYALYYPSIASTAVFMQERLYVPLLTGSLAVFLHALTTRNRLPWFALTGLLFGAASLTRSMPLFFVGPAALGCWLASRDRKRATVLMGVLMAGFALVVVPYCLLLFRHTGHMIAIENTGAFGVLRAHPAGRELVNGEVPTTIELITILWQQVQLAPFGTFLEIVTTALGSLQSSVGRGLEWSWSFPSAPMAFTAKWLGHAVGDFLFVVVVVLAPLGVVFARKRLAVSLIGLWIVVHMSMTALAGYGGPRFRRPIEPVLFVLAACAVVGWRREVSRRVVLLAVGASVIVGWASVRTLPYSLGARADYGIGVWQTSERGRTSVTTAARSGFNTRATDHGITLRLWHGDDNGFGAAETVDLLVDGIPLHSAHVPAAGRTVRLNTGRGLRFVELRRASHAHALGLELHDHAAGVGR